MSDHDEAVFDRDVAIAQLEAVATQLGDPPRRVLDLGCGGGRMLVPLAEMGHALVGVDWDDDALACCRENVTDLVPAPQLVRADFVAGWPDLAGDFDAVLCVGNTLMTVADVDDAVRVLTKVATVLAPGGALVIDDLPLLFWPEVTEGNWQSGCADDMQLVWEATDSVFSIRTGPRVDPDVWTLGPEDERRRLWTDGELRLVATAAGLSAPTRIVDGHVLVMRSGKT